MHGFLKYQFTFYNVSLDETINLCVNDLVKTNTSFHELDKKQILIKATILTLQQDLKQIKPTTRCHRKPH